MRVADQHRILFATHPASGHVNPALPIAAELVRRGHDVVWCTGKAFRAAVESTGARFVPSVSAHDPEDGSIVDRFPERIGLTGLAGIKFDIKHVFLDEIPHQVADLHYVLAGFPAELVVADAGYLGSAASHELGGPPWVTLGVTPLALPSRDLPPFGPGLPPTRNRRERLRATGIGLLQRLIFRDVEKHYQLVRGGLGLPPTSKPVLASNLSPYLMLQSGTSAFEYARSDLPEQVHFVGPLLATGSPCRTPEISWSARANGKPLVLVTQGTVVTESTHLVDVALSALAEEEVFVVAVTGGRAPTVPIPANAAVESFIPYDLVMREAAAVVTNGGYGGVQHALAHGVPLVVAGQTEDKPEVAARVEWFEAGVNLRTAQPTAAQVRSAVRAALDDPSLRAGAERIRDDYARHDSAVEASNLIEQFARTGLPVLRKARSQIPATTARHSQ